MSMGHFTAIGHHFNDLASDDEAARLEASCAILAGLEGAPVSDIQTALNRLVKGLASGRKSARIGFSTTLTELLARLLAPQKTDGAKDEIKLSTVLELLKSHTVPEGKVSGKEERDNHFGRLFGLDAVLQSGVVFQSNNSHPEIEQVLDLIYDLAIAKPWLREECGWILCQALQPVPTWPAQDTFARLAVEKLSSKKLARTPEGVAIHLTVHKLFPAIVLPNQPWRHRDPLHGDDLVELAKVLKESPVRGESSPGEAETDRQRGMWNSNPHFAWDMILSMLCSSEPQEGQHAESKRVTLDQFWRHAVDESLFSAAASKERKYWGFMLVNKVFTEAPRRFASTVFSENMTRCLVNHLSHDDRYLHRTALRSLKVIQAKVDQEPDLAFDAVLGLTKSGWYNFDHATKRKTIQTLLGRASDEALESVVIFFRQMIQSTGDLDPKAAELKRQTLAGYLVSALRSRATDSSSEKWTRSMLEMFAVFGYPSLAQLHVDPTPSISMTTQTMFRSRLSAGFAHLMTVTGSSKTDWPYSVLKSISPKKRIDVSNSVPDQIMNRVRASMKNLKKLDEMEQSGKKPYEAHAKAMKLLYSLVIFQVYDGFEDGLAVLSEIDDCFDKTFGKHHKNVKASSEILVEVLLSLVSKPSLLLRKLSQQVFTAFAGDVSAGGLWLLLDVLQSKESIAGQQALFDDNADQGEHDIEESSSGVDEDSASSMDIDSDVSVISQEEGNGDDDEGASNTVEDSDELQRLNAALAEITGTKPFRADGTQSDRSSSDEDMDDDEMFALDDQMASVFKERRKVSSKKSEKRDAKETIVNFKNRVLDLLELYVKHQHENPLVLNLILPLLTMCRTTTTKQIADRGCGIIRELSQKCKGKGLVVVESDETVWALFADIHQEAKREASRAHATACSQSSLVLVKVLISSDPKNVKRIVAQYGTTQTEWLQGQCRVQPSLFSDFLNWSSSYSKQHQ